MSSRYVEATFTSIIPHSDHIESLKKKKKTKFSFCNNLGVFLYIYLCILLIYNIKKIMRKFLDLMSKLVVNKYE